MIGLTNSGNGSPINSGLRTVAEGIETVTQYRMLAGHGCREGQGYLFSKPLEAADFRNNFV